MLLQGRPRLGGVDEKVKFAPVPLASPSRLHGHATEVRGVGGGRRAEERRLRWGQRRQRGRR